jgi:hypothetical protein
LNVAVLSLPIAEFELRRSPVGLPKSLDGAADPGELPEFLMTRIQQPGSRGGWVTRSTSLKTYVDEPPDSTDRARTP